MNSLKIKGYAGSVPEIVFDGETGNLTISGDSCPEDVLVFFENLYNWLYDYIEIVQGAISLTINLRYFNTSSSRGLFRILTILKSYLDAGGAVDVTWHYDEDDTDTYDEIVDMSEEANIAILKVPY
jgi:hypothetical protein